MGCVENEYHFVLVCPAYRTVRLEYLPKYYCSWPNIFKLFHLLQAKSKSITIKLCSYLKHAWKIRSCIVNELYLYYIMYCSLLSVVLSYCIYLSIYCHSMLFMLLQIKYSFIQPDQGSLFDSNSDCIKK